MVAVWLGVAGLFIYHTQSSAGSASATRSAQFVMREGVSWLVLRRNEQDAGYARQSRTELVDGWLLEQDTYLVIDALGAPQPLEAAVKARLDIDGYLRQFTTEITTAADVFKAAGKVEGETLRVSISQGEQAHSEVLILKEPVRIVDNALNTLLASETFVAGESYGGRFFDPYAAALVDVQMRFIENRPLDVYEEVFQANHFRRDMGERELDYYVDGDADLLIRAFPLRMIGARVPGVLGKTRAASIRRQLDERLAAAAEKTDAQADTPSISLDDARAIFAGQFGHDAAALQPDAGAAPRDDHTEMKLAE